MQTVIFFIVGFPLFSAQIFRRALRAKHTSNRHATMKNTTKGHRAQGNFVEYKYLFFQKIIKFWYKTHRGYTRPLSARHMMWWRKTKRNTAKLSLTASYRPFPPFSAFSPRENPGTALSGD
jgi:hypothetical protein